MGNFYKEREEVEDTDKIECPLGTQAQGFFSLLELLVRYFPQDLLTLTPYFHIACHLSRRSLHCSVIQQNVPAISLPGRSVCSHAFLAMIHRKCQAQTDLRVEIPCGFCFFFFFYTSWLLILDLAFICATPGCSFLEYCRCWICCWRYIQEPNAICPHRAVYQGTRCSDF